MQRTLYKFSAPFILALFAALTAQTEREQKYADWRDAVRRVLP